MLLKVKKTKFELDLLYNLFNTNDSNKIITIFTTKMSRFYSQDFYVFPPLFCQKQEHNYIKYLIFFIKSTKANNHVSQCRET